MKIYHDTKEFILDSRARGLHEIIFTEEDIILEKDIETEERHDVGKIVTHGLVSGIEHGIKKIKAIRKFVICPICKAKVLISIEKQN